MPRKDPNAQQKEGNSFLGDVLTNAGNIVADDAIKEINGEPIDLLTGGLKRAGTAGRVSAAAIEYSAEAIQDAFLDETTENKKMLDIYVKYIEGYATNDEIEEANYQLKQVFKSLGLGILVILPFSPISIPYVLKRAKEYNIDLIPDWYKALSKDEDRIE